MVYQDLRYCYEKASSPPLSPFSKVRGTMRLSCPRSLASLVSNGVRSVENHSASAKKRVAFNFSRAACHRWGGDENWSQTLVRRSVKGYRRKRPVGSARTWVCTVTDTRCDPMRESSLSNKRLPRWRSSSLIGARQCNNNIDKRTEKSIFLSHDEQSWSHCINKCEGLFWGI